MLTNWQTMKIWLSKIKCPSKIEDMRLKWPLGNFSNVPFQTVWEYFRAAKLWRSIRGRTLAKNPSSARSVAKSLSNSLQCWSTFEEFTRKLNPTSVNFARRVSVKFRTWFDTSVSIRAKNPTSVPFVQNTSFREVIWASTCKNTANRALSSSAPCARTTTSTPLLSENTNSWCIEAKGSASLSLTAIFCPKIYSHITRRFQSRMRQNNHLEVFPRLNLQDKRVPRLLKIIIKTRQN